MSDTSQKEFETHFNNDEQNEDDPLFFTNDRQIMSQQEFDKLIGHLFYDKPSSSSTEKQEENTSFKNEFKKENKFKEEDKSKEDTFDTINNQYKNDLIDDEFIKSIKENIISCLDKNINQTINKYKNELQIKTQEMTELTKLYQDQTKNNIKKIKELTDKTQDQFNQINALKQKIAQLNLEIVNLKQQNKVSSLTKNTIFIPSTLLNQLIDYFSFCIEKDEFLSYLTNVKDNQIEITFFSKMLNYFKLYENTDKQCQSFAQQLETLINSSNDKQFDNKRIDQITEDEYQILAKKVLEHILNSYNKINDSRIDQLFKRIIFE